MRITADNTGAALQNNIPYYIVVRAKDSSAAQNIETNTIEMSAVPTRDEVPPPLDLDPQGPGAAIDGLITRNTSITVSGSTEAGATVGILNQQSGLTFAATVDPSGVFSGSVSLVAGQNTLIVTATDPGSNQASQSVSVNNDIVPPVASISTPAQGQSVSGSSVAITGTANDAIGLAYYSLDYGPGATPSAWRGFATGSLAVNSATLATWDTTGKSGEYTIRLTSVDISGNSSIATTLVTVSNTVTVTGTIPAGAWVMVGVPGAPLSGNPSALLGTGNYALRKWDPNKTQDDPILLKYDTEFSIATGNGFWVRAFGAGINYSMTLEVENTTSPKSVHLFNGWNQIGAPFNRSMLWGDVRVVNTSTGQSMSMSQAAAAGWIIGGVAYGYSNNAYAQKGLADRLEPMTGYFVKCGDSNTLPGGCDLVFDPGSEQQNGVARIIRPPSYDMKLQIAAKTSTSADEENYIGVLTAAADGFDAFDSPEPPTIEPYVSVYFPKQAWERFAGRYAGDVRPPFEGERTWEFVVDTDASGDKVTVYFPNAEKIPDNFDVSALDADTGVAVNVFDAGGYTYTADGAPRRFIVTVRSGAAIVEETTLTHTIKPGWSLVTFPLDPRKTDAVEQLSDDLGELQAFQFYENEYYSPDSKQRIDIQAGVAYWINLNEEKTVDVTGKTIPLNTELVLPLAKGWNLIGNPYTEAIAWGDNIRVEYGGKKYTLQQAAGEGILAFGLYSYDGEGQKFAAAGDTELEPWRGYMIKALLNCSLVFSAK